MTELPPFLAGQEAYRQGQPCTPPDMPEGDCYPGARQMWIDGWNVERGIDNHSQQLKRKAAAIALLQDGRPRTKSEIFASVGEIEREHFRRMVLRGGLKSERVSCGKDEPKVWIYTLEAA